MLQKKNATREEKMYASFAYFEKMATKLKMDAQVLIAYHWRKYRKHSLLNPGRKGKTSPKMGSLIVKKKSKVVSKGKKVKKGGGGGTGQGSSRKTVAHDQISTLGLTMKSEISDLN